MDMITIKKFVEEYNKCDSDNAKERYIKNNLKIIPYLSFVTKSTLASKIMDISMYEYESFADKDETIKRKKTGNIKADSVIQYLLFYRIVIENYTNLKIETEGFYEEYDLLNQANLIDKIMQQIPEKEIDELKTIIDMKKNDIMINVYDTHNYISRQINNFSTIISSTLKPALDNISNELSNLDDEKINKIMKAFVKA